MGSAHLHRLATAFVERVEAEAIPVRHLVAALHQGADRWLLVRNDPWTPEDQGPFDGDPDAWGEVNLDGFVDLDLSSSAGPWLVHPDLGVLRPELDVRSGNCFDLWNLLRRRLPRDRWLEDFSDTLRQLASWMDRQALLASEAGGNPKAARLGATARRLRVARILTWLDVRGLLGLRLAEREGHREVCAWYVSGSAGAPDRTKDFDVHQVRTLDGVWTDQPQGSLLCVPAPVGIARGLSAGWEDLTFLLDEVGKQYDWYAWYKAWTDRTSILSTEEVRLFDFLEDPARAMSAAIRRSGSPASTVLERLEEAERAYVLAGVTADMHLRARGPERIGAHALSNLGTVLRQAGAALPRPFVEALATWYAFRDPTTKEGPTGPDIAQRLRQVRSDVARFTHFEGQWPALHRRLLDLDFMAEHLLLVHRGGLSKEQIEELEHGSGPPILSGAGCEPLLGSPNAFHFTLAPLGRTLGKLHQLEVEAIEAELAGEDASTRAARMRRLAARIRDLPRFLWVLPHEEDLIRFVCEALASRTEHRADQIAGRPLLQLIQGTSRVVLEEESTVTLTLENIGLATAHSVLLQLFPSDAVTVCGESARRWDRVLPLDKVDTEFVVATHRAKQVDLVFEVIFDDQGGAPQVFTVRLAVDLPLTPGKAPSTPPVYPAGTHIKRPADFHGRRSQLSEIMRHIGSGSPQSFLIKSPRRTGKSSLLRMIRMAIDDPGVRRYFELSPSWDVRLDATIPVFVSAQDLAGSGESMEADFFRALLGGVRSHVAREIRGPETVQAMENTQEPALRFRLEMAALLGAKPRDTRVVFLVDEFDTLNPIGPEGFWGRFRSIVDNEPSMAWVLVSATGLHERSLHQWSPLFNVFQVVQLEPLSRPELFQLVRSPAPDLVFLDEALNQIYSQAGGNPFVASLLCNAVIARVYADDTNVVRRVTVTDAAMALLRMRSDSPLAFAWEDASDLGRALLVAAARPGDDRWTAERLSREVQQDERIPLPLRQEASALDRVRATLDLLVSQNILSTRGGAWKYAIPLMKSWLDVAVLADDPSTWFRRGRSKDE